MTGDTIADELRGGWPPPGIELARTPFPERRANQEATLDRWARSWATRLPRWPGKDKEIAARLNSEIASLNRWSDDALRAVAHAAAGPAFRHGDAANVAATSTALAATCVAAHRVLGWTPHPPQRDAAVCLLRGRLVELDTGEGKTLAAALAACVSAMAGVPTHVVTVNDYLAERDARAMQPLFDYFGLGVGLVHAGVPQAQRPSAYSQPITYCTNKELVFDYLRDRMSVREARSPAQLAMQPYWRSSASGNLVRLRGLHFAIVDEADSVLIDEGRTPMVIASAMDPAANDSIYRDLLDLAAGMRHGEEFRHRTATREIQLTDIGRERLHDHAHEAVQSASDEVKPVWALPWARERIMSQALRALHLLHRDRHYIVREGRVVIVDESTGRLLPDRSWEQGLHQLVETKEGLTPSGTNNTLARITSQRFFTRYLRLAGMSGTLREVAPELRTSYGLQTERVAPNRPCRRRTLPPQLWPDCASRNAAVVREIRLRLAAGQAVLVGTASIASSRTLSQALETAEIAHRVLDALNDANEAELVARAGRRGAVTVCTDMAGRGTDIALEPAVVESGGLHVVLTEWHESKRIDRQLLGRCARQGDPGSCRSITSLEDEQVGMHAPREAAWVRRIWPIGPSPQPVVGWLRRITQHRAQRAAERQRSLTVKQDQQLLALLAFTGVAE
ncbi:DEAD/DEAH box helicase [Roseateles saccharophilus]|uniref:Protein translocase subunit secA n=1 Tax=Roseateles saccharophilus TaxID=304 RepID=A0A4R3ULH1_ROSSA|nr:DEAD/DEAH box helicase [Roseateles saccharophilus]MDG0833522.1 hypothetical protein [Roseateles saccharophilus]TCU92545.1 protein translocase subunit secA [Roseateles saccharophilus]